jgi:hypothetical protein
MHRRIRLTDGSFLYQAGESHSTDEPGAFTLTRESFVTEREDLRVQRGPTNGAS